MTTDLTSDRKRLERLTEEASTLRESIARRERECRHDISDEYWGPVTEENRPVVLYEPDPSRPVFAGVDVVNYEIREVRRTHRWWTRRCGLCGTVQHTDKTRQVTTTVPDFG